MAETKTLVYDGTRYRELTLEPVLKDNKATGHYKEIGDRFIIVDGIFDDKTVADEVMNFINNLHKQCKSPYYVLEIEKHYNDLPRDQVYLFSSFGLNPEYESLGEAVIMFMLSLNWTVTSYNIKEFTYNGETIETIYFTFNSEENKHYWHDNAYLFPIDATTFSF